MPRYAANVVFKASAAHEAVRRAKRIGKQAEHSYKNVYGQMVRFAFIGPIDVIDLEGCNENEAYYSMRRLKNPRAHVRADNELSVFVSESRMIGSAIWAVPKALARGSRRTTGRRRKA